MGRFLPQLPLLISLLLLHVFLFIFMTMSYIMQVAIAIAFPAVPMPRFPGRTSQVWHSTALL